MNKLFLSFLLITAHTISFASDRSNPESKPVVTFLITLELKNNPTHIGESEFDEAHQFSCNIFNISWPEQEGSKLWHVQDNRLYQKTGNTEKCPVRFMPINQFVNNDIINPYMNERLKHSFSFPDLPDDFVKEMVENSDRTTKREVDKAILHFKLLNSRQELERLELVTLQRPSVLHRLTEIVQRTSKTETENSITENVTPLPSTTENVTPLPGITENVTPPSEKKFNIMYVLIPAGLCSVLAWWLFAKSV